MPDGERPLCYFIGPFGKEGTPERRRIRGVYSEIVRPAVPDRFELEWALEEHEPGILTETIFARLLDAELVIADLTGRNPNVFYELALRHVTGKASVQMTEDIERIPFDVSAQNTISFESTLSDRSKAVERLRNAIDAAIATPALGNPITNAARFRAYLEEQETTGDEAGLADLVRSMHRELRHLRGRMDDLASTGPPSGGTIGKSGSTVFPSSTGSLGSGTTFSPGTVFAGAEPMKCGECGDPVNLMNSVFRSSDSTLICNDCASQGGLS